MKQIIIILLFCLSCANYTALKDNTYLSARINANAEMFDLDPTFVSALINAESGFYKYARSSSHAFGYMQIKQDTAVR
jgi:soluble lytic murein transglycosylase-like protein